MQRLVSTITQAALAAAVLLAVPLSAQNPAPSLRKANYPFGLQQAEVETDSYLISEYNDWWRHYVTATGAGGSDRLRVQRDSASAYDTVSEGQSYGMLLAVYFGDRTTFDALYRYAKDHYDPDYGLMQWMVRADGVNISEFGMPIPHERPFVYKTDLSLPEEQHRYIAFDDPYYKAHRTEFLQAAQYERGYSSATDADMDIAIALCFAHGRWGSTGAINYLQEAAANIKCIVDYDSINETINGVSHRYLRAGSKWGQRDGWNASYFMPAWLRIFAKFINDNKAAVTPVLVTPDDYIAKIADLQATMYSEMQLVNANNGPTGLYPDWCDTSSNAPAKANISDRRYYLSETSPAYQKQSYNFFYDAVRVPWRIGLDYSLNGDADALSINTEMNQLFRAKTPAGIVDGYSITGGAWSWDDRDGFNSSQGGLWQTSGAFMSMVSTACMTVPNASRTDTGVLANAKAFYAETKKQKTVYTDKFHYYGNTLRLLSLLYMSGRMPDLTEPERPSVSVQFMTYNANANTNTLFVNIKVKNTGDIDVDLAKLATSYWFAAENTSVADVAEKDAAFVMNSGSPVNTAVAIATASRGTQNRVQNTTFPGVNRVLKKGEFVELHLRIHKSNWTNYNQGNDYSFSANYNFADTNKITVYYGGTRVAGTEP